MSAAHALLFFVKFPAAGQVKTRLAAEIGPKPAVKVYRHLVETIAENLPPDCDVIVPFAPPDQRGEIENWLRPFLPHAQFAPQCAGDLGARLAHSFNEAFTQRYERVAAIGSDCVEITDAIWAGAFHSLDAHDVAIGPSADGGYYLLALKKPQPALFQNIAWSSARTCADTLERARAAGLAVARLPELRDVDTKDDWKIAQRFLASATTRAARRIRNH